VRATEKWMEGSKSRSPACFRVSTCHNFYGDQKSPTTGNQVKLNAWGHYMTSLSHLFCPVTQVFCRSIFFTECDRKAFPLETLPFWASFELWVGSRLLCSLENLKVTTILPLWLCGTKSCLLSHCRLCADNRPCCLSQNWFD